MLKKVPSYIVRFFKKLWKWTLICLVTWISISLVFTIIPFDVEVKRNMFTYIVRIGFVLYVVAISIYFIFKILRILYSQVEKSRKSSRKHIVKQFLLWCTLFFAMILSLVIIVFTEQVIFGKTFCFGFSCPLNAHTD